jgi:hypothetical protein
MRNTLLLVNRRLSTWRGACARRESDNLVIDACFALWRIPHPERSSEMANQLNSVKRIVAYFSMEIALENAMPSYSGGLGVLTGRFAPRTAAHGGVPALPRLFAAALGRRLTTEEPVEWRVEDF